MYASIPKMKLSMVNLGDKVKMVGDSNNRTFTVEQFREDGYVELYCNGRPNVTTCLSTEIVLVNP